MERLRQLEGKERSPATVSVSLLLTHGRAGRLLLTRHGIKEGEPESWGLIAGGVRMGENPWDAALREAWEEANIEPENIIFVKGRDSLEPHVAMIRGEDKIRLGLVFGVTYSGPKVPLDGWEIGHDSRVDRVKFFTWREILDLIDNEPKIYRPYFNTPQLLRWTLTTCWQGSVRTQATCQWLLQRSEKIPGLSLRKGLDGTRIDHWQYTPPYNEWVNTPWIHGRPSETNFARERFFRS